jgi:hypothetical protein
MNKMGWRTLSLSFVATCAVALFAGQPAQASSSSYPPIIGKAPFPSGCVRRTTIPSVPPDEIQTLEKEVTALAGSHFEGIGQCGHGLLDLELTAGSESTAARVRAKFGPLVQIIVGLTVWNGKPGRSPLCGTLARATRTPAGYSATLKLRTRRIKIAANLRGTVVLRDMSAKSVRVLTDSPIEVVITKRQTRRVVGIYSGAIGGVGFSPLLRPGRTTNVAIAGGTARCDGGIGSALPPGRYDAVAEVSGVGVDGPGDPGHPPPTYFTDLVPIQIVVGHNGESRPG